MAQSDFLRIVRAFPATSLIIAFNVALFIITVLKSPDPLQAIMYPHSKTLIDMGGSLPARIWEGEYWRFLSAMALHANVIHLFFNCYVLFSFCAVIERELGSLLYFAAYVATGIGATAVSVLLTFGFSVGASGAVFGIIGIVLAHHYRREITFEEFFANPIVRSLLQWILIITVIGFFLRADHFGHFGGLAFGFGLGLTLPTIQGARVRWVGVGLFIVVLAGTVVGAAYPKDLEVREQVDRLFQDALDHLNAGENEEAIALLEDFEEKGYISTALFYYRALARERSGDLHGAHVDYTRALEREDDYLDALVARARVVASLGKIEEAILDLERALEVAPENWEGRAKIEVALKKLRAGSPPEEKRP